VNRTVKTRLRGTLVKLELAVISGEAGWTETPVPGRTGVLVDDDQARAGVVARSHAGQRRSSGRALSRVAALTEAALVTGQAATALRRILYI